MGKATEEVAGKKGARKSLLQMLGPGLITGASDDDPSGIATYSQAGAQFGYGLGWTLLLTYPLMAATQEISARIGQITGRGLAGNIRQHLPAWLLHAVIVLLTVANAINIGADLGAMGAAVHLLIGGPTLLYVMVLAGGSLAAQIVFGYARYAGILKWLTLSLLAYVATVLVVSVPWAEVGKALVLPTLEWSGAHITMIVAIFGTTISPYLFFWQAEEEVEEQKDAANPPLKRVPGRAGYELRRIRLDTYVGMGLSNAVALCILITAAASLHAQGIRDIESAAQAAEALRPVAGDLAFAVFALGILGTGLLAVPVLAGSAAYAIGESRGWPVGLGKDWSQARKFYITLAIVMASGAALNVVPIDPMKALVWSAVVNGVLAAPIMAIMLILGSRRRVMGTLVLPRGLCIVGWIATATMAIAAGLMFFV